VSLGSFPRSGVAVYREQAAKKRPRHVTLDDLAGWRVNTGVARQRHARLMGKLLHANGIERESLVRSRLELTPRVALLSGELDAIVFTSGARGADGADAAAEPGGEAVQFGQARPMRAACRS